MKLSYKNHLLAALVIALLSFSPNPLSDLLPTLNIPSASADDQIVISGKVLGSPVKPVVTGKAVCANNKLTINLDWPTDENSESFDIRRNGELLATNIINSFYEDNDVTKGSSNTYQVIAHGPMGPGSATSDEITVSTPSECAVTNPPLTQEIRTVNDSPIGSYDANPKIEERRPTFSGKTNIPYAKIEIVLDGSPQIFQTIFANANGFWSWQSPEILDFGAHTFTATAIDPDNADNKSSSSFAFTVYKKSSDNNDGHNGNGGKKKNSDNGNSSSQISLPNIPNEAELLEQSSTNGPFQITTEVGNFNHYVFSGENLSLQIDFSKKTNALEDKDFQVFYEIVNSKNEVIYVDSEMINILRTKSITKKIPISALASIGEYRIRVKAYDGKILIAGENFFTVKELPIINIGFCTLSLSQIIGGFGWLLIGLLLFFLFLFKKERKKIDEEIYQVTEEYLDKDGFISHNQ